MSCGMPNMVPVESRFSTAFITAGWQCPAISAPKHEIVIDVFVAIEIAELAAAGLLSQKSATDRRRDSCWRLPAECA